MSGIDPKVWMEENHRILFYEVETITIEQCSKPGIVPCENDRLRTEIKFLVHRLLSNPQWLLD